MKKTTEFSNPTVITAVFPAQLWEWGSYLPAFITPVHFDFLVRRWQMLEEYVQMNLLVCKKCARKIRRLTQPGNFQLISTSRKIHKP